MSAALPRGGTGAFAAPVGAGRPQYSEKHYSAVQPAMQLAAQPAVQTAVRYSVQPSAQHSKQHPSQSSIHISAQLRAEGIRHIEDLRSRQMQDMQRLLLAEKEQEVERQARAFTEKDPDRKVHLRNLAMKQREKSREKILRIAREHELALASRMGALGILR